MNTPSFEPRFSPEHLVRRIHYLEQEISSLPTGSVITRDEQQYIRVTDPENNTFERILSSKDGQHYSDLIDRRKTLKKEVKSIVRFLNDPPPKVTRSLPPIIRSTQIPFQLTLDYYNNPPEVTNPYPNCGYVLGAISFKSRFELIAAQAISELGLPFRSELPILTSNNGYLFMDIVIPVPERGRCVGFEFCGMMENHKYMHDIQAKMISYADLGMVPNHDVFYVFGGEKWLPTKTELQNIIIFAVENC